MRFFCLLVVAGLSAQTTPLPTEFDVATIRQRKDVSDSSRTSLRPGGRIEASNVTLTRMMMAAYDVTEHQIVDAPAWVERDRWDVEAKAEGLPANAQPDQVLPLLRKLLEDRFQVRVRREKRQMPVYHLTVERTGHKLTPSTTEGLDSASTRNSAKGIAIEVQRGSMGRFAQLMSRRLGRAVVDQTGLTGIYDFKLEWTPELAATDATAEPTGPSVFTAVREQLGLRLDSGRDAVEVLVVERAEHPAEN